MMEQLTKIVSEINGFLWGMYCLIPLLCGVGIYFTLKLDFIQIRRFGLAVKSTFGGLTLHGERAGKQGMSSFQSSPPPSPRRWAQETSRALRPPSPWAARTIF